MSAAHFERSTLIAGSKSSSSLRIGSEDSRGLLDPLVIPHRLVVESEENQGMIYPLRGRAVSIGRGPQNQIQVIDTRMSRVHTHVKFEEGKWIVLDSNSKNGTIVNNAPIHEATNLVPGDQIQVGNTVFSFEEDSNSSDADFDDTEPAIHLIEDDDIDTDNSQVFQLPEESDIDELTSVMAVPEEDNERLRSIYQIGKLIQTILDEDEMLEKVMEIIFQVLRPTQSCIMLYDRGREVLVPKAVRAPEGSSQTFSLSGSIVRQAMDERAAILMNRDSDREPIDGDASVVRHRIKSALCVPLIYKHEVLGLLYLDVRNTDRTYSSGDLQWAAGVASQAAMAIALTQLHMQLVERSQEERELEIARTIQMNLLPKKMPSLKGVEFGGVSWPARMVGGDYFDIIELQNGNYALVIADVSGKGVPSALLLASFRSAVRMEAQSLNADNLVEVVSRLNETIYDDTTSNMFITMVLCFFESTDRRLTYCNAGHNYPIVMKANGSIEELDIGGSLLGILPGMDFEKGETVLESGSLLAFTTDGVTDALNPDREPFGAERLVEFISENRNLGAQEACDAIEAEVRRFQSTAEQFDDLTVMMLKIH